MVPRDIGISNLYADGWKVDEETIDAAAQVALNLSLQVSAARGSVAHFKIAR